MKSVLYRPGSKWPLFAAFAAAVAIHVSALAFTPVHRSETFGSDDFPVVGFEPSPPEPSPEPEDNQPTATTPPPLFESNEYTEEARPTPRRLSSPARPIHTSFGSTGNKSAMGNGKIFTLAAPRPDNEAAASAAPRCMRRRARPELVTIPDSRRAASHRPTSAPRCPRR